MSEQLHYYYHCVIYLCFILLNSSPWRVSKGKICISWNISYSRVFQTTSCTREAALMQDNEIEEVRFRHCLSWCWVCLLTPSTKMGRKDSSTSSSSCLPVVIMAAFFRSIFLIDYETVWHSQTIVLLERNPLVNSRIFLAEIIPLELRWKQQRKFQFKQLEHSWK